MSFKASIVIPCFNEELNLPLLIKRCEEIHQKNNLLEFIFVNNGSTDNSKKILKKISNNYIKVVNLKNNLGYGGGIIQGLKFAKNEIVGWTHADLQTDPNDLNKGIKLIESSLFPDNSIMRSSVLAFPAPLPIPKTVLSIHVAPFFKASRLFIFANPLLS